MGEQLNISLLIAGRLTSNDRVEVVRRLLEIGKPWAGDPHDVRLNFITSAEVERIPWTGHLEDLPDLLAFDVLLHIYLKGERGRSGVLTIEQGRAVINLTLSLPLLALRNASLREIESVVMSVRRAQTHAMSVTIVGAEFEADTEAGSVEEALRRALADTSLLTFIAGPQALLSHAPSGWLAVDYGSTRLLRHRYAEWRLRGQLGPESSDS